MSYIHFVGVQRKAHVLDYHGEKPYGRKGAREDSESVDTGPKGVAACVPPRGSLGTVSAGLGQPSAPLP